MLEHVFAGLLGGLLASGIVVTLTIWWQKLFVPWLENRLYKGPRIDGLWEATIIREEGRFTEHIEIEQFGYRIHGKQHYPKDRFGNSHRYSFEGEFRDRTLAVIYREIGSSAVEIGAIVLHYEPLGTQPSLQGHGVWPDEKQQLRVEKYEWLKQGEVVAEPEKSHVPVV